MWQNSSTGDVNGRQGSKNKIGGSVCAVLLDLIAMGKIKIEFEEKKFLFVKYTDIWVKVSWIEYIRLSFFVFLFLEMPFLLHALSLPFWIPMIRFQKQVLQRGYDLGL